MPQNGVFRTLIYQFTLNTITFDIENLRPAKTEHLLHKIPASGEILNRSQPKIEAYAIFT